MEAIRKAKDDPEEEGLKLRFPEIKLPRSRMYGDVRYQGEGGLSRHLEEDVSGLTRNYKLRVHELARDEAIARSEAETRGRMYLKIFRLRTVAGEKMDAKALGRDEKAIYKAMFDDFVLLRVN